MCVFSICFDLYLCDFLVDDIDYWDNSLKYTHDYNGCVCLAIKCLKQSIMYVLLFDTFEVVVLVFTKTIPGNKNDLAFSTKNTVCLYVLEIPVAFSFSNVSCQNIDKITITFKVLKISNSQIHQA